MGLFKLFLPVRTEYFLRLAGFFEFLSKQSGLFAFLPKPKDSTCRPTKPSGAALYIGKEASKMYILECTLALLKDFPSFVDIIVRHALEILSAM